MENQNQVNIELISDYIKTNSLTKQEFCERCKICKTSYYKIMQGKDCSIKSLFRVARGMNIPIHKLFVKP